MFLFLIWVAMGALVGWLASVVIRGCGGAAFTVIVGIVGGIVGGVAFRALGLVTTANNGPTTNGMVVSLLGAVALTAFAQATLRLWRTPTPTA